MRQLRVIAKPVSLEGRSTNHLRSKGYSPSGGVCCKAIFGSFSLLSSLSSVPLQAPQEPPLSASFPMSVLTQAYAGEVTPSQAILSSNTFSEMVPLLPSKRAGTKTVWTDVMTSSPPPKHTGIPNVRISFKHKWLLLLILCSGLPISC